jgi:SAM-dependent methyltransferase
VREVVRRIDSAVRRRLGWRPYPARDHVSCVLCGSEEGEIISRRVQFEMAYQTMLCASCGLLYLNPRPTASSYAQFYDGPYQQLYGVAAPEAAPTKRGSVVAGFLAEHIDRERHTGIFDIGCGGGGLLRALACDPRLAGMALAGCDPGWSGVEHVFENGREIKVHGRAVEELDTALASFSLFVLYDVLEHLLDPRAFLRSLHRRTDVGSELFISTTCLDNWQNIPPAGWESYYLRLAHPYTFSGRTLEAMLACEGWRVRGRRLAPKGDQWVLATRGVPVPIAAFGLRNHPSEVRAMIGAYRARAA